MKTCTTAFALLAAGTLVVGPAFAQATSPSSDKKDKATSSDSSTMKSSDSAKSSDMKSHDTMKSTHSGKGATGGSAEQVRAVQQALKDKGHDPGEVDGKMGPKTQAALRDFQSKEGLKASGRLDGETMAKLGVEANSSAAGTASTPSASPSTDTKTDSSKK